MNQNSKTMKTLKYYLTENLLTPDPSDYRARVELSRTYTMEEVKAEMLKRGTSLTMTDINAVLTLLDQVLSELIAEGLPFKLSLCKGAPSISGIFDSPDDAFDSKRHQVKYKLQPGALVLEALKKIKTEKTVADKKMPHIGQFKDVNSQTADHFISPGGIGELQGSLLKFDANDPEQGIRFVAEDGSETRVSTVVLNKPSKLIFMIPPLAAGEYELVLRVKFKDSKQLRQAILHKRLTVTA
jgi:hypothetical protein